MTEAKWRTGTDPMPMLAFLRGKTSDRKLRLFACAFCLSVDDVLAEEDCCNAVKVAERFADGLANPEELQAACTSARLVWTTSSWGGMLAAEATDAGVWRAARGVLSSLEMDDIPFRLWMLQSDLLRDVFGPLPFRPVARDSSWLLWNDSTVCRIAQGIYEERAFDRLPILADILLDAGCDNEDILAHCRSEGPHVRGCWVLDLILGKE